MSVNNNRMKWWEKFHNKDVNQEVSRNTAVLRDLARAAFLKMLHVRVNLADIDEVLDNLIKQSEANYSEEEILKYIIQCAPELNKQEEDTDD